MKFTPATDTDQLITRDNEADMEREVEVTRKKSQSFIPQILMPAYLLHAT